MARLSLHGDLLVELVLEPTASSRRNLLKSLYPAIYRIDKELSVKFIIGLQSPDSNESIQLSQVGMEFSLSKRQAIFKT